MLGLATPARRLFTEAGTEVTSLDSLASGQLLLVSTGEVWMPAKTVKEDAERKLMLANLAEDLNKLAFFNRVKSSCQNLVIEALKGGLCEGTRLGMFRLVYLFSFFVLDSNLNDLPHVSFYFAVNLR